MDGGFSEVKLFQVKPDKQAEFEALVADAARAQREQPGCLAVKYVKRFYTIDGVEPGNPPRPLTRVVKSVKYLSYWEFSDIDSYGRANQWFFARFERAMGRLLIMPFDIYCGDALYR